MTQAQEPHKGRERARRSPDRPFLSLSAPPYTPLSSPWSHCQGASSGRVGLRRAADVKERGRGLAAAAAPWAPPPLWPRVLGAAH
eukprot:CAMPEP_0177607240 /NCGR_PEP_ID=MMETSP0419_2-20121207/17803_1 /TAXON_ID=582737 /ORGANISM="Tetraselmis sp., Strain GSL018" /LENGTH=84 /DNA_ID=CAMNT_0019101791 /DNA_START=712 /DNA_END=963 /DNA_ORIENTATION=-